MKLEHCTNFLLLRTSQLVNLLFKAELEPYGVTPGQSAVLKCLWDKNGQAVKQLAERLILDSSSMTSILDRLEQKGLIERHPDAQDRRALKVLATEKAGELEMPIRDALKRANEKSIELLGETITKRLVELLPEIKKFYTL